MLDNAILRDVNSKSGDVNAKCEAVNYLQKACGISERRAHSAMAADRSSIRCESKRPDDMELREQLTISLVSVDASVITGSMFCSSVKRANVFHSYIPLN